MKNTKKLIFDSKKMIISGKKEVFNCLYDDVLYIYSDRPYSMLQLKNCTSPIPLSMSIQTCCDNLPSHFFLCNRSTFINLAYCVRYEFCDRTLTIEMADRKMFAVSHRRQSSFLQSYIHYVKKKQ